MPYTGNSSKSSKMEPFLSGSRRPSNQQKWTSWYRNPPPPQRARSRTTRPKQNRTNQDCNKNSTSTLDTVWNNTYRCKKNYGNHYQKRDKKNNFHPSNYSFNYHHSTIFCPRCSKSVILEHSPVLYWHMHLCFDTDGSSNDCLDQNFTSSQY